MIKQHFTITEQQRNELARRAKRDGTPMSWQVRQALEMYLNENRVGAFAVIRSVLRQAVAADIESADNALELLSELER